ncbi:MAG: hypothetical protein ACJ72X_10520 [Nitrososphaeraceae archaeon]
MQKWNFYGFHRGQASSLASHQTKQISDGEKELLKKEKQIVQLENDIEEICKKLFSEVDLRC